MVGLKMTFCMYISIAGAIFFLFISFCCFCGMEALHLPEGKKVQRGMQVLLAALVKHKFTNLDLCRNRCSYNV